MKELRVILDDKEHKELNKLKKGMTWKEWILRKDLKEDLI